MRLKESRRVPMWNGPIECRLFRFDMVKGSLKRTPSDASVQGSVDGSDINTAGTPGTSAP
jgi:putative N6-adenine-specific DNA methylase